MHRLHDLEDRVAYLNPEPLRFPLTLILIPALQRARRSLFRKRHLRLLPSLLERLRTLLLKAEPSSLHRDYLGR